MMKRICAETSGGRTSRRQFTKSLTVALIAAPSVALAQTPAAKEPKAPPNAQPTPATTTQTQPTPKPSPIAVAYAEVARARFGEKLTPEELERVRGDLEGNVRAAERLRTFKLKNSDEPDFVFSA